MKLLVIGMSKNDLIFFFFRDTIERTEKEKVVEKRLNWAIENLKKCYVHPDTIVQSKMGDDLKFRFSCHYINQAVKDGLITIDEFMERLKDGIVVEKSKKMETETCLQ